MAYQDGPRSIVVLSLSHCTSDYLYWPMLTETYPRESCGSEKRQEKKRSHPLSLSCVYISGSFLLSILLYIYIYIERERERREMDLDCADFLSLSLFAVVYQFSLLIDGVIIYCANSFPYSFPRMMLDRERERKKRERDPTA